MLQFAVSPTPFAEVGARRVAPVPAGRRMALFGALKLLLIALAFVFGGGYGAYAQFDENNPAIYWRQEQQRQMELRQQRSRQRVIIQQRPTRLIRRAQPRPGYTRAVPAERADDASAPAPAEATAGAAPDAPAETAAAPIAPDSLVRIAVLGDNIAHQLGRGLAEAYDDVARIEIAALARDNSGLVRDDYYDWVGAVRALLEGERKIDIAVMMIGSNDRQPIREGGVTHSPGGEEWTRLYAARIEAIASLFQKHEIPLIWLGMPAMRNERLSVDMAAFNQIYRDTVRKNGGVFVDVWEPFVDDRNRFTLYGPDVNGELAKLRMGDGVHFTRAGARKLAHFASIDIKRIIEERKPASAFAAPGRYDDPSAGEGPGPTAAQRPAIGPVLSLTAPAVAADGALAGGGAQALGPAGPPAGSRPGRADDFSWPRP